MALLGSISGPKRRSEGATSLAKIGADGAIIEGMDIEAVVKELASKLNDVPWGIKVGELTAEQATQYRDKECDFLAFGPGGTQLSALEDGDTAYVLCIEPDMDERYLRAIEDLPVDAVLLPLKSAELPLTVEHLMTIGSVRSAFSKYLLLELSGAPTAAELEALRDIGVDGLVVDATSLTRKELAALKERLMALSRRQRTKSKKPNVTLPHSAYSPPGESSPEEEEDEF